MHEKETPRRSAEAFRGSLAASASTALLSRTLSWGVGETDERESYCTATSVGPAYFFSRRSTFSRTISGSTTGFAR